MKSDDGDRPESCRCCKVCADCTKEFQKLVDLKGLVIYRHLVEPGNVLSETKCIQNATRTTDDAFILQNTKDIELTSADFLPELEVTTISCERCRQILEHAQKLLQKVSAIDKNDIKGICDHCRLKQQPCFECQEAVKKFFVRKRESKDNAKEKMRVWVSQVKSLLKDAFIQKDIRIERKKSCSELSIDKMEGQTRSKVDVKDFSEKNKPRFSITLPLIMRKDEKEVGIKLKTLPFFDAAGRETQLAIQKEGEIVLRPNSDSDFMFHPGAKQYHKARQPNKQKHVVLRDVTPSPFQSEDDFGIPKGYSFIDGERIMARALPRSSSHGILDKTVKDFRHFFKTRSRSVDKDPVPRRYYDEDIIPPGFSGQYKHLKEKDLGMDLKESYEQYVKGIERSQKITERDKQGRLRDTKYNRTSFDEQYSQRRDTAISLKVSDENKKDVFEKDSLDDHDLSRRRFSQFDKSYEEEISNKAESFPLHLKKSHSEETLLAAAEKYDKMPKDFSFTFPREDKVSKKFKRQKSSSELIKDTQAMLNARAEEERKRLEEERKKKSEEEEKKRLAREERERLAAEKTDIADEKKRLAEEKRKAEEEKKLREEIERKLREEQKPPEQVKPKIERGTPSAGTSKGKTKEPKEKPKLEPPPKVNKEAFKAEKDAERERKEKERKEKEEKLRLEKEAKEREKDEKERLRREKEEQARIDKEEKERLKREKEDQARKEKELKQKQKELEQKQNEEKKKEKKEEKPVDKEKAAPPAKKQEVAPPLKKQEAAPQSKKQEAAPSKKQEAAPPLKKQEPQELNMNKIKMRKSSQDDLILQLVKLKQSQSTLDGLRNRRASQIMTPQEIKTHKKGHYYKKGSACAMCVSSDLELQFDSKMKKGDELADIIIGQKIFKYKPPLTQKSDKEEDKGVIPLLFQSNFIEPSSEKKDVIVCAPHEDKKTLPPPPTSGKQTKPVVEVETKGVIRYALSDRTFIDKGWTMLPTEKVVRKMNVYRMRPAHPEFDWFEHNKNKRLMQYDSGERLAEFDDNGRGRWYYRNGRLALDYYDAEELNAQQRFVVYSSGEPDERGRSQPYTILATFDYLGNGIVFDHSGKIRLKYNQTEGVVLDRNIGPVSHWKWHTLNDPPVLQQVMIDTQMAHKDPQILKMGGPHDDKTRPDNEEMLAIEFDNFIKEKSKKLSQSFKPFQIKMKALKINENFSLKVLDQATVYLIFRDGTTNLKLNIGMILDHKEIVDTDTAEVGEVSNNLERFPARTDSLAELQNSVAYAQRFERTRTERERRLRPSEPCGSADKLTAAASRPMRFPLRTVPTGSSATSTRDCSCKCTRKPTPNNFYYDNRLF